MNEEKLLLEKVEGLGEDIVEKLKEMGIETALDLAVCLPDELLDIVGGNRSGASYLINQARIHLVKNGIIDKGFITAKEMLERRKKIRYCTTGSRALDGLLGGGIETAAVTEVYGAYSSGKSQLCHTLSVLCQLPPEERGLGGGAIYIDTEGGFRAERVREIAIARGLEPDTILKNILYARVYNVPHLEFIIRSLGAHIRKHGIKLVIVDSIIGLFRSEFIGREFLSERQQRLNVVISKLRNIAEMYNIAVVITNQIQTSPNIIIGDPNVPAGGNILSHGSTYRIYLRRSGKYRIATIIDSPYHPFSEVKFLITEAGISDE